MSHKAGISAVFNIAFEREGKKRGSYYNTGYSYLVTHPGTHPNKQGSTMLSGQDVVLSLWHSDQVTLSSDIGWEKKERKNERNENEDYYLLW